MDKYDIIEAACGATDNGRCKSTLAFFVEELFVGEGPSNEDSEPLDEFFVEKPIVKMYEETSEGQEYYCFDFVYRSARDEDLKLHWRFLDNYVKMYSETSDESERVPVLIATVVPISLNGEFTIFAKVAIPESIVRVQYAGENECTVKMMFVKDNVFFMQFDEEIVDKKRIEADMRREFEEEARTSLA